MRRGKFSASEKKLMILEILSKQKTATQIARERGISDSQVYKWRDAALKALDEAFTSNGKTARSDGGVSEKERLLKIIGEQACVIDTLKKTSEMLSR